MEITKDKVTELFCIIDEFYKVFDAENAGKLLSSEMVTVEVKVKGDDGDSDDDDSYTITTTTIITTIRWQNGTIEKELLQNDK